MQRRVWRWLVLVISVVTVGGFLISSITGNGAYFVVAAFYSLIAFLGMRIVPRVRLRRSAARLGEVSMTIGDDGLHVSSALATSEVRWAAYRGYVETDDVFVIYLPGWSPKVHTLPKRVFPDDHSVERLRRILRDQFGPALF